MREGDNDEIYQFSAVSSSRAFDRARACAEWICFEIGKCLPKAFTSYYTQKLFKFRPSYAKKGQPEQMCKPTMRTMIIKS